MKAQFVECTDLMCPVCGYLLTDKVRGAAHASPGSPASVKQPRLMKRHKDSSDIEPADNDSNSCLRVSSSSSFDHERGQAVNNSQAVLKKIASLCENDSLSDIELVVCCSDGADVPRLLFPAHKLILCCSSDVLKVMLMNPAWPDSSRPSIELHEEQSCVPVCCSA